MQLVKIRDKERTISVLVIASSEDSDNELKSLVARETCSDEYSLEVLAREELSSTVVKRFGFKRKHIIYDYS